ncbi:MAG: CARDB domain-containing protein [bacterium]
MENKEIHPKIVKIKQIHESSMKSLSIVGLIAILAVISFGLVKATPAIIRGVAAAAVSLSSVFIPAEKLVVSSDAYTIGSGDTFTLKWALDTSSTSPVGGSYTISYPCIEGVHLEAVGRGSNDIIFCNTVFHFLNNDNSLALVGYSTKGATVNLPVSLYFTRNEESSPSTRSSATITITGETSADAVKPPVKTAANTNTGTTGANNTVNTNTSNTGSNTGINGSFQNTQIVQIPGTGISTAGTSNPNGSIDLTANILETGYINKETLAFVPAKEVKPDQRAAIRFEIVNLGTKAAKDWTFAAVLPTFPGYIFQSNSQPALNPGDRAQFTLGFDSILKKTENEFVINVDPIGSVQETNKTNNIIKGKMYVNLSN